jgi:hypothetical protein
MSYLTPGLLFYADSNCEGGPKRNELYTIIDDGSIRSVHDPSQEINWEIVDNDNGFFYRTKQDQTLKECFVRYHGRVSEAVTKVTPMDMAIALNDPVQVEAMFEFEKRGMSYAEMRAFCG